MLLGHTWILLKDEEAPTKQEQNHSCQNKYSIQQSLVNQNLEYHREIRKQVIKGQQSAWTDC